MDVRDLETIDPGKVDPADAVQMGAQIKVRLVALRFLVAPFRGQKRVDIRIDAGVEFVEIRLYLSLAGLNLLPVENI